MRQCWYQPEDPLLFGNGKRCLASDKAKNCACTVFSAQLNNRKTIGRTSGQAHGAHGPEAQSVVAPPCYLLDRKAGFKVPLLVSNVRNVSACRLQRMNKRIVLLPRQTAVEVVRAVPAA